MRIFICGKMTGEPHYGFEKFQKARHLLESQGHEVLTGFDSINKVWREIHGRSFYPQGDVCAYDDPLFKKVFVQIVADLLTCDAIALLPDYIDSVGAMEEYRIAIMFELWIKHL
jgi:hypothetical protein